jgi:pyocin large subunit-like protein
MLWASDGVLSSYSSNSVVVVLSFVCSSSYFVAVFCACVIIMSVLELEQRTIIKFLVKLSKTGTKIREMLVQVDGDKALITIIRIIIIIKPLFTVD